MKTAPFQTLSIVLLIQIVVQALTTLGSHHWNIALGVLFLGFWSLPVRWWPALALANLVSMVMYLGHLTSATAFICACVMPSLVAISGVAVLRKFQFVPSSEVSVRFMAVLHIAALVSALIQASTDVVDVIARGQLTEISARLVSSAVVSPGLRTSQAIAQFGLNHFVGAFVGIMLLAPLFIAWATRHLFNRHVQALKATAMLLLPMVLFYLLVTFISRGEIEVAEILRLLLMVSVLFFAMRYGWQGAVLAVLSASVSVAIQSHLMPTSAAPLHSQTFIAIVGALGLLLGASTDEHRGKTREMRRADLSSEQLRFDLAVAAEGNMHRELRERNRIARELQDEFGQSLTALQTQLALLRDDFRALGRVNAIETLNVITRGMRHNISSVLERLRPAVLDELGLYGAIEHGSIRRLAEDAGIQYEVQLFGDSRWLALMHDAHKLAAYRLVQESVTNVVRHSHATRCQVRLRINSRNNMLFVFVEVRDDGMGMTSTRKRGNGLQTMQHRVTALDGRLRLSRLAPGLRVHAVFRQNLSA